MQEGDPGGAVEHAGVDPGELVVHRVADRHQRFAGHGVAFHRVSRLVQGAAPLGMITEAGYLVKVLRRRAPQIWKAGAMIPTHSRYVVIGAGVHGLSTSWHLARELRARGLGEGEDICVLDKRGVGVRRVRHRLRDGPQQLLPARDARADGPFGVGVGVGPRRRSPTTRSASCRSRRRRCPTDVAQIYSEQRAIGYPSVLIEGNATVNRYLTRHVRGLAGARDHHGPAREEGRATRTTSARSAAWRPRPKPKGYGSQTGVRVTGFGIAGGAVTSVETDQGTIACDQLVVAVGPWIRDLWAWLDLPETITVARARRHRGRGPADVDLLGAAGRHARDRAERVHRQRGAPCRPSRTWTPDAPLYDDISGDLITDQLWGIYYKPDFNFAGLQGGASPYVVGKPAGAIAIDPYGPESPEFTVPEDFVRMWTSGLAHCHKRFEGKRHLYRHEPHRRDRRVHPGQLPGLRRVPAERLRDRRLQSRVQDDRRRGPGRQGTPRRAAGRCSSRSGSAGTPRASCTR